MSVYNHKSIMWVKHGKAAPKTAKDLPSTSLRESFLPLDQGEFKWGWVNTYTYHF